MRFIIGFIIGFAVISFVAWLSGYNFNERGSTAVFWFSEAFLFGIGGAIILSNVEIFNNKD